MTQIYLRLKIRGVLTNHTDLMIGSGQEELQTLPNNEASRYTGICLADQNKPYIPASSLRGLLRDLGKTDDGFSNRLFGAAKNVTELDTNTGALRIYDAIGEAAIPARTPKRTRNAINPITGAAKDNFLYSHAYVPAGSKFNCEIEADQISLDDTRQLLGLLEQLNANNPFSQLGKGQSKQHGLINWGLENIEAITDSAFHTWLLEDSANPLPWADITDLIPQAWPAKASYKTFALKFAGLGPILINDPQRTDNPESKDEAQKNEPDLEYYRNSQNQLVIPATSLIGVMRSQCRKILLTLLINQSGLAADANHDAVNGIADNLIDQLFGNTSRQSRVWLSDCVATETRSHLQTFNAVDRFTGGVADGALYTAKAASAAEMQAELYFKNQLDEWEKGLLILLLRDAMEGDLTVGWGKAKGYGGIALVEISHAEQLVQTWSQLSTDSQCLATMQAYVDSLHNLLKAQGQNHD